MARNKKKSLCEKTFGFNFNYRPMENELQLNYT